MKSRLFAGVILIAVVQGSSTLAQETPQESRRMRTSDLVERPSDPRGEVNPRLDATARSAGLSIVFGSYTSVQVNVDALGQNIVGDAANEPSIAVSLTNPDSIAIGWRQFDTITSNFRQAGWSYTTDGGATWTFPGSLEPGIFRSDPVLGSDSSGNFYYQSLTADATFTILLVDLFQSTDGGATWPVKTASFGGDKNWLAIDKSGAASDGHIYGIWQRFFSCCNPNVLTRSTNGGASFETPVAVDLSPTFGTLAVGPDGVLYMGGIDGTVGQDLDTFVVSRSTDAANPALTPTSTGVVVDMGGSMIVGDVPNPGGLLGQADVAVDLSSGPSRGNVYLLASVSDFVTDPLDVHFVRSVDGGATWSPPVRVNDDASFDNWQWLGAIDVAPDGRIDVIWNDTRADSSGTISQLFYSYSMDTGLTWAKNVAVSPTFDSTVGYPQQNKMGDYIDLVSDATGAGVAYTATFNGEQDVYFVRLFPDCNENGIPDEADLSSGSSPDDDGNGLPDECDVVLTAGAVPDGAAVPGAPLTVEETAFSQLLLSWGPSCSSADDDYAVYEGVIGDFGVISRRFCTTGGQTHQTIIPLGGNTFYLVVPLNLIGEVEGSYGLQTPRVERLAPNGCFPQAILQCQAP